MIRLVIVLDPAYAQPHEQVIVHEYTDDELTTDAVDKMRQAMCQLDVASASFERVSQWWPATWQQVLTGCEVLGDDGKTWVVSRGLSSASPHEVEIYEFGHPDNRFTFTPRYDQPVQARFTHEAQMMALLMTELGARVVGHEGPEETC